jgi:hypothetical protein
MAEQYEVHSPGTKRSVASELLRLEEDCIRRGKAQSRAGARWARRHYYVGIPAVLSGILAGMAFSGNYPVIATGLSTLAAVLTALMTFLRPSGRAAAHKTAESQYLALHNEMRVFREVALFHACNDQTAIAGAEGFTRRLNELDKASRRVSPRDEQDATSSIAAAAGWLSRVSSRDEQDAASPGA